MIAANGWVNAMVDAKTVAPVPTKEKPVTFKVQSPDKTCAKHRHGKVASVAEMKKLKACFVATRKLVDEKSKSTVWELEASELNDEHKKIQKAAKGTVFVGVKWTEGLNTLDLRMAVAPDFAITAAWMVYLEQDGE